MAITRKQKLLHKQFLNRQKVYENRYSRQLLSVLASQYIKAAMDYNNGGNGIRVVSPEDFEPVYKRLYATSIVGEAKHAWDIWVTPLQSDRTDIIDRLT